MVTLDRIRFRRLIREGSWIVVGQIVTVFGSLVLVKVLTGYLEPIQYGQLALGLTIATLINQTVMAGVTPGIVRFYSVADERHDLSEYLKATRRLLCYALLGVCGVSMMLMAGLVLSNKFQWIGLAGATLVFSVLSGVNATLSGIQNAARQRAIVAIHSGLDAWLKLGLAVGVMLFLGSTSTAVVIGYILSILLVTLSQVYFLRRLINSKGVQSERPSQDDWARQIWLFSWPMMAGGLFNWGFFASQRWALELFATTEEVGKFFVLSQIAYAPISLLGAVLLSFLNPIMYMQAGDATDINRLETVVKTARFLMVAGMIATFVVALIFWHLHHVIFSILVDPQYHNISLYMPQLAIAAGIFQVSLICSTVVTASKETSGLLVLSVSANIIAVLLNLLLTKQYGAPGLVYALIAGSVVHFIGMLMVAIHAVRMAKVRRK